MIESIDAHVQIVCVDDACPQASGTYIESLGFANVTVIYNPVNLGVGGAVKAGYLHALAHGKADIFVKIDGDGQMPGEKIAELAQPIAQGSADYVKGNRFYYLSNLKGMPLKRLIGNSALSFFTKLSSGYWDLMDPTNGFTAISRGKLAQLELDRIDNRYFFESDMLCKLYLLDTVVKDYPMKARYADENSSLRPLRVAAPFLLKNMRNTLQRIFYTYFVRDFNAGSLALVLHLLLGAFGLIYGAVNWVETFETSQARAPGVVMLAALCIIFSVQFLIFFLTVDIQNSPNVKRR
jgi:glycosyltransferase involved in cell wall biosynthesis